MSLVQDILFTVTNYPGGYRLLYDIIYENKPPAKSEKRKKENILRVTLSRMKKSGLLKNKKGDWTITPEGKKFLESKKMEIRKFFRPETILDNREKPKRLIIIFDIPEKKKKYREWLRMELVGFGFNLVQKSVWIGPALSKEFVEYLDEVAILKHIRFFRATEKDLI